MIELEEALTLAAGFERCQGYPRDDARALARLAGGIQRASKLAPAPAIVERWLETSRFMPSDADLMGIARGLRGPNAFPGYQKARRCPKCDETGWERVYTLRTHYTGAHNYVAKERMTEAEYAAFDHAAGRKRTPWQEATTAVRRCGCGAVDQPIGPDAAQRAAGDVE